ncbi:MAG: dephospho-CoA kinase [Propionibacteriaceae bacterium]|jgi:dephospho-CoA kinase|nr:dephospho-CoA kinase [Propionibacteriaceae bacterium]
MMRIGLTGGIAAGKTVAGTCFTELGITVLDYDQLARDVVVPGTPGHAAVVGAFGAGIVDADGSINRAALAAIVFPDHDALDRLESIIHPLVIDEGQRLDTEAEARGERLIVHSIPLLVESAGPEAFDVVVVIDAPMELRVERLVAGRKMTEAEAWDRINAQIDDDFRLEAADVVFDGSGSEENLRGQVEAWVTDIRTNGFAFRPNAERTKFLVTEDAVPDKAR